MTEDEARQMVLEILGEIAPDLDQAALDPAVSFRDQSDFDSVDFLNLAIALSERLNREIPETDYPRLSSLSGCVDYLTGGTSAAA